MASEDNIQRGIDYLVNERGYSREDAARKVMMVLGTPAEKPAEPTEPTLRERFAGGMEAVAQAVEDPIQGLTYAGMRSAREPAMPGAPSTARLVGKAFGSVLPRTPEGVALSVLPFTRPGAALMTSGPRAMATLPVVGAGGAYLSRAPDAGVFHAPGAAEAEGALQGFLGGAAAAGTRGVQRLGRRIFGQEPSVRNVTNLAKEQVADTATILQGMERDAGLTLSGRNPAEKIIKGPEHVQQVISADFGAMQRAAEDAFRGQTVNLPFLAQIRGKTITIPGTPGTPPSGLVGPTGQPVGGGTPGIPSQTVIDPSFTVKEAMDALKDFGGYVRAKSYNAAGDIKGQEMTFKQLRDLNRAVRAELQGAFTQGGRMDIANQFRESSAFYARGKEFQRLLEDTKPLIKGGGTQEGALDTQAFRDLINSGKVTEPQDFPATFEAAHRFQPLGARELQRPGINAGQRVYGPSVGFQASLPATRIPIGTQMQVSGLPSRITGAGTMLGVENLLKDFPTPRRKPAMKDMVPLMAPSVGVE